MRLAPPFQRWKKVELDIPANNCYHFVIYIPNNLKWFSTAMDFIIQDIEITQFFGRMWLYLFARGN
jgi:hypothetical protein